MITKREVLSAELAVWAVPKQSWEGEDVAPFKYELKEKNNHPWQSGSVKVCETTVEYVVPAGVNLYAAALQTLEEAKTKAAEAYHQQIAEIDQQISQMKLLAGPNSFAFDSIRDTL